MLDEVVQKPHARSSCHDLSCTFFGGYQDLKEVKEEDLREENVKKIPLRRFLEKQRSLMAPFQPASEPSESVDERIFAATSPISRVSSVEHAQGLSFDWSMVGEEKEDKLNAETNPLDSWEFFETSLPDANLQLTAKKAVTIEVPHFTFDGDRPKLEGPHKMSARPMLWKLRPEEGWAFLTMQFPGDKDRLKKLVETYKPGFPHQRRTYYYVSSSSLAQ